MTVSRSGRETKHTLLCQTAPFVRFKLFLCALFFNTGIALCLCKVTAHLLVEQLEAIHLVNGILRRLDAVEDDKCLPLSLQTLFRYNVDYVAVFRKDFAQRLDQGLDLDALFEVLDVDAADVVSVCSPFAWSVRCAMYERCVGCDLFFYGGHFGWQSQVV